MTEREEREDAYVAAARVRADRERERPILFSAPMVRAIIEGRKTRTRRIVKWPKKGRWPKRGPDADRLDNLGDCRTVVASDLNGKIFYVECPYGGEGDRLWVRETFCVSDRYGGQYFGSDRFLYRADYPGDQTKGWTPSIHIPRAACRLVLDVTEDPDMERLQEITNEGAIAEGIFCSGGHGLWTWDKTEAGGGRSPREAFLDLFGRINGRDVVRANPFVWVVKFRPPAAGVDSRVAPPG